MPTGAEAARATGADKKERKEAAFVQLLVANAEFNEFVRFMCSIAPQDDESEGESEGGGREACERDVRVCTRV